MRNKNKQRWLALWQRIGAHGDPHAVYNDLVTRYSESHRAYHTLAHIQHCLDEFEQVRHLIANPDAVEIALWYHDAIYDTKAKDNEEKSAALVRAIIQNASLPDAFGQFVADCIMATKHTTTPTNPDIQFWWILIFLLSASRRTNLMKMRGVFAKNTSGFRKRCSRRDAR